MVDEMETFSYELKSLYSRDSFMRSSSNMPFLMDKKNPE